MVKIQKSTSRGQITLPKEWREKFETEYFQVEILGERIVIMPLKTASTLDDELDSAWQEYKEGKDISHEALIKKY